MRRLARFLAGIEIIGDLFGAFGKGIIGEMINCDQGGVGQIIERRRQCVMEERQPVFDTRWTRSGADRLIDRIPTLGGAETAHKGGAEMRNAGFIQQDLTDRIEFDRVQLAQGPLGFRVKRAD